jgi:serine protease AprX
MSDPKTERSRGGVPWARRPADTPTAPHRRRHLRTRLAIGGVVAGSVGLVLAAASPAEPAPAAGRDAAPAIRFSMEVKPGQPVPVELITDVAAQALYDDGYRGEGIDVALIDTGVAPVAGLDQPGKVLYGPDLSNEGGGANVANLDTYGHGTHMAGIIAGDDGQQVVGVAPDSRIVSVKVGDATGATDVVQVVAAIDWVVEHKNDNGLDIRVLNLSLGYEGVKSNEGDILSAAVERAWDAGIVVVAAVGNRGNSSPGIDSPAISPYVIAVGGIESFDSQGTTDTMAAWSSGGNEYRTPDVVAPGRSILSFRVPGSMLDQMHPQGRVGERYFRGTGTSQSVAVVTGFTAALLSKNPSMTPDQVKFLFQLFADDIADGTHIDGNGKIDVAEIEGRIEYAAKAPVQSHPRAWEGGNDSGSKLLLTSPTVKSTGDDRSGASWSGASWSGGGWSGASWSGGSWSGASWSGASWSGASWSGASWSGGSWSGASWSGASWSGASWSGASWSGASWSGASWSGASWSGASWSIGGVS